MLLKLLLLLLLLLLLAHSPLIWKRQVSRAATNRLPSAVHKPTKLAGLR
jgi:hypothetical protein